jgi:hypothetical protein
MIGNVEMWLATPFIPDIFSSPVLTEEPWKEDRPMVIAQSCYCMHDSMQSAQTASSHASHMG